MDRLQKTTYIPTFDHVYGLMYEQIKTHVNMMKLQKKNNPEQFRSFGLVLLYHILSDLRAYVDLDANFIVTDDQIAEKKKGLCFDIPEYCLYDLEITYLHFAYFMTYFYFLCSKQYEKLVTQRIRHRLSRWIDDPFFDDFIQDLMELPEINHINGETQTELSLTVTKQIKQINN
jgi:hypothetical protein